MNAWICILLTIGIAGLFAAVIGILLTRIEVNRAIDRKIKDLESPEGRETDPLRKLLADPLAHQRLSAARKAEIERELEEAQKLFYGSEERRTSADE